MTEKFKTQLIENLQWLGDQKGKQISIIDRLTTVRGNYDRHFTRTSRFTFVMEDFGVRFSGAIARMEGDHVSFEFRTDCIIRIERNGNNLEFESNFDTKISRLINISIEDAENNA